MRRVDAEEKLRRGLPVTIPEIVQTYCELVGTDRGRIPVPESVVLLKRKAAEAAETTAATSHARTEAAPGASIHDGGDRRARRHVLRRGTVCDFPAEDVRFLPQGPIGRAQEVIARFGQLLLVPPRRRGVELR